MSQQVELPRRSGQILRLQLRLFSASYPGRVQLQSFVPEGAQEQQPVELNRFEIELLLLLHLVREHLLQQPLQKPRGWIGSYFAFLLQ